MITPVENGRATVGRDADISQFTRDSKSGLLAIVGAKCNR
jgi:hypothetical protein